MQPDICRQRAGSARQPGDWSARSSITKRGDASHDVGTAHKPCGRDRLTCWLISRMAISFRSVKSSNADSITLVCVSDARSAEFCRYFHEIRHTAIHDEKVLLLLLVDVADSS